MERYNVPEIADNAFWVGAIIRFAGARNATQYLGTTTAFIMGAFPRLIAIILLAPMRQLGRERRA